MRKHHGLGKAILVTLLIMLRFNVIRSLEMMRAWKVLQSDGNHIVGGMKSRRDSIHFGALVGAIRINSEIICPKSVPTTSQE